MAFYRMRFMIFDAAFHGYASFSARFMSDFCMRFFAQCTTFRTSDKYLISFLTLNFSFKKPLLSLLVICDEAPSNYFQRNIKMFNWILSINEQRAYISFSVLIQGSRRDEPVKTKEKHILLLRVCFTDRFASFHVF